MVATPDLLPSGSWGIGPLLIKWDLKPGNEIDVQVSALGINLDTLSGSLDKANLKIEDKVDLLGIVTGNIELLTVHGAKDNTNGLHIEGRLSGPGFDTGKLDHILVHW